MSKHWMNGLMLLGIAGFAAANASQRTPERVISPSKNAGMVTLEQAAALNPGDPQAVRPLVQSYLDQDAPGLAVAVLERAPRAAFASPSLGEIAASAYLSVGRSEDALVLTRHLLAQCDRDTAPCEASFVLRNARREQVLTAIVDMGIKDPMQNPEAVALAYQRTVRQVRVAM